MPYGSFTFHWVTWFRVNGSDEHVLVEERTVEIYWDLTRFNDFKKIFWDLSRFNDFKKIYWDLSRFGDFKNVTIDKSTSSVCPG